MSDHLMVALEKGAIAALYVWSGGRALDREDISVLTHDMWLWVLTKGRESTRAKIEDSSLPKAIGLVKTAALQHLSEQALAGDTFNGKNLFTIDTIKDELMGIGTNRYLSEILPVAMENLNDKSSQYHDILVSRYVQRKMPEGNRQLIDRLKNAHKAILKHVNIISISAEVNADRPRGGAAGLAAVDADTRREHGAEHSDPTGDAAVKLVDRGSEVVTHNGEVEYMVRSYIDADGVRRAFRIDDEPQFGTETITIREAMGL